MGRKRKERGKIREPLSISIPRDLIIEFDGVLDVEASRSRVIEEMIRSYVRSANHSIYDFGRFGYQCAECGRSWTFNQNVPLKDVICRIRTGGCGSDRIEFLGNMDLEEEE